MELEICSFRLVLEGKTGTELPESSRSEFLEKFLANNFALLDAEDNTSSQLNKGGIGQKPKVPRAKFLGSDGFFYFSSICKFGSFKNPFAMITSPGVKITAGCQQKLTEEIG